MIEQTTRMNMGKEQTEVLVVGAGPVGLWTALLLADAGVETTIIDHQEGTAARSYACALHPATLHLLDRFDLAGSLINAGRCVEKAVFYRQNSRQAELRFTGSDPDFPFLLILPQNVLESALEKKLDQRGVPVLWRHRFDSMETQEREIEVTIEELGGTGTGYIVPHWEMMVRRRLNCRARFLIGADGHNSLVRNRAGMQYELFQAPQAFAAYEFRTDPVPESELRIVLDDQSTNVLWPVAEDRLRWTFQIVQSTQGVEFPEKERRAVRLAQKEVDDRIRQYVERVAQKRAPWFKAPVKEITWCTQVAFAHQLAHDFGGQRYWLAGDAAHQTGPAGVQSMNAGFVEMAEVAPALVHALKDDTDLGQAQAIGQKQHQVWRKMFGIDGGLKPRHDTDPWIAANATRILPCLPAVGENIPFLANQLKLDY